MKASVCLLLVCLSLRAHADDTAKLEVHEWGTFTVLSGSDGAPLHWFQGPGFLDELPPFVQFNRLTGLTKASAGTLSLSGGQPGGATVRMETPVIYFYPEKPLCATVSATFVNGSITEWFPAVKQNGATLQPIAPLTWEGNLLPPTDATAQSLIPTVPRGKGEHYRHAREVPEAWIFHSTTPALRDKDDATQGRDAERFIFYRGVGHAVPPYRVRAESDGTVWLRHWGQGDAIKAAFTLTVKAGMARWVRLPRLEATLADKPETHFEHVTAAVNTEMQPVAQACMQLTEAVRGALVEAGLTADEARAMVATWEEHWFREPGTRVLAIMPRSWVDSVLPLTITPKPQKLTRVFVARFEVFTPERENGLLGLLNEAEATPAASAKFAMLNLGRFAQGALQRAQNLQVQHMRDQFTKLEQVVTAQAATAAR